MIELSNAKWLSIISQPAPCLLTTRRGLETCLVECYSVLGDFRYGGVSELADEHDLGSCAARRGGSSPPFPSFRYEICNLRHMTFQSKQI